MDFYQFRKHFTSTVIGETTTKKKQSNWMMMTSILGD